MYSTTISFRPMESEVKPSILTRRRLWTRERISISLSTVVGAVVFFTAAMRWPSWREALKTEPWLPLPRKLVAEKESVADSRSE
ncbi:hypothetical protein Vadar_002576 [Vaccinium darrowii]|uniref:Uncharacterized protein n=1 Tax=Vaccinium darrowii TaxID=229202 RepID=A0ACB7Y5N8_9ERIC|nr:hypothetical protein Vadar_002576 [Vaccinium darrowii]